MPEGPVSRSTPCWPTCAGRWMPERSSGTAGAARTEVPWTLPWLCRVWNHEVKQWAATWWAKNSKEAYSSGLSGVDLGVHSLAVVAAVGPTGAVTAKTVANPKALSRYQGRLGRLQRRLSRHQPGSRRRTASMTKLARRHLKVRNRRADTIHKLTT